MRDHLVAHRPVVVTDALASWRALHAWTPRFFKDAYGSLEVSLKGVWVEEVRRSTVGDFVDALDDFEAAPCREGVTPYLRTTYPERDGGDDFTGRAFAELRGDWARPYFLPRHGYVSPPVLFGADPTVHRHPHFGIYLSPRGAVTRLHVDGGESDAVLCQLFGEKRCYLIAPSEAARLPGRERRPAKLTDTPFAPDFGTADVYETTLRPGDTLFIPRGFIHEVYTLSASVSLTYNFVHLSDSLGWSGWARLPESLRVRGRRAAARARTLFE